MALLRATLLVSDKVVADCSQQFSSFPTRERPCRPSISRPPIPRSPSSTKNLPVTYMRMLEADAEGADWHEGARIVLHIDPEREPDRARLAFESHLARAKWVALASLRLASRNLSAARIRQDGRVDSPNSEVRRVLTQPV